MRKIYKILFVLLAASSSGFGYFKFKDWQINPGFVIKFDGKYADGTFSKLDGKIQFDPSNLTNSAFDVTVDVKSIDTGKDLKNKHALSDKWFNAEQYPVIHFISTDITKTDSLYTVHGNLELHGITKPISIPFAFKDLNSKAAFQGRFKVNRGDFGIGKSTGKDSDSTNIEVMVPVSML